LKFVVLADTHSHHRNVKLPKGDVLIHAGDISYRGKKSEMEDFVAWFKNQDFAYKIFIAGNHDFFLEKAKAKEIEQLIPEGIIYLNDSGTVINGINIWGSPITPKFFNWAFNSRRGEAIKKHWDLIPATTDLLITHGPPYGILDQVVASGEHVGCKDLLNRVKEVKPKLHVFGHIHESYGTANNYGIKFINASLTNELYEVMNAPITAHLDLLGGKAINSTIPA
jgi:Icc-related predicted phosphoesterase